MNTKSYVAAVSLLLAVTILCLMNASETYARSTAEHFIFRDAHVVITRYEVHGNAKERVAKALSSYVKLALSEENNIMAEVFQEEEQPFVLWLIERWDSKDDYKEFSQSTRLKEMRELSDNTLFRLVKTYQLKDVAPLSKSDWRRSPAKEDDPIVIMLFVDSKPGTESTFARVYDEAMPKFRSEPGVITYALSQSEDDKTQFVTYEKFRSEDAFRYHLNFPPIQPVLDYLNTSIKRQPFQAGLHRLVPLTGT